MPKVKQDQIFTAIGLMSGTSLDGIDVALLESDGKEYVKPLQGAIYPYSEETRIMLRKVLGNSDRKDPQVLEAADLVTKAHIKAVQDFMNEHSLQDTQIHLIGFHGQTIYHEPPQRNSSGTLLKKGTTLQIGSGEQLAKALSIPVIYDFRSNDMAHGGEGAPLVPVYHRARAGDLKKPVAILNIGGIANVTWIGGNDTMLAFDTGPGNVLMDDWVLQKTGKPFDRDGALAAQGQVQNALVQKWLSNPFFQQMAPKSLDRDAFGVTLKELQHLATEDAVATLAAFTVESIAKAQDHFPERPQACYITGGGSKNDHLMKQLSKALDTNVSSVDSLGWNADFLEAQAFAYLAVRSKLDLPLTYPGTTGVLEAMVGGENCS
ncbi:MAG: anhydro-N-acetylmuramic acid kinase [Alphaproteobacteria bacterium]|jgi:anhydro-N-acetylmuramic acid kinase|nr:anhydro-N-acetylmuramic acid kinase [Alphaproteobacteria bacterium]MBT5389262.1 anhydro-N-acetylmuramic acid kinase [Alphaproteobacteria bacterium]MBT5654248.1 anhydro-N-acetylmuramic acid kinase [Alphaproteobacteria bacterium]